MTLLTKYVHSILNSTQRQKPFRLRSLSVIEPLQSMNMRIITIKYASLNLSPTIKGNITVAIWVRMTLSAK